MNVDAWGVEHAASEGDLHAWADVVQAVVTHHEDTARRLDGLLEQDPNLVAALLLKGFALLFKGRRDLLPVVDAQIETVERLTRERPTTEYEALLLGALLAWRADDYDATERSLARLVEAFPANLLAVKLQHGFLFLAGRRLAMAQALEAVLPRWTTTNRGYGYVLGCAAFAWEELGRYSEAERLGHAAVELAPDDAWGIHAVSHIHEMRDENQRGADWLNAHRAGFEPCNNFRGHVFWHLALFELALENLDRVWALCDGEVRRAWAGDYRDMSNVASLLWRLEVDGFDVGERWDELGAIARQHHRDHGSAFADAHYALALGRAGHKEALHELVDSIDEICGPLNGQLGIVRGAGKRLCAAIADYVEGRFMAASRGFEALRDAIPTLGGSNAQRDLFEQLEIHAAIAADDATRTKSLLTRRLMSRPQNPWALARIC